MTQIKAGRGGKGGDVESSGPKPVQVLREGCCTKRKVVNGLLVLGLIVGLATTGICCELFLKPYLAERHFKQAPCALTAVHVLNDSTCPHKFPSVASTAEMLQALQQPREQQGEQDGKDGNRPEKEDHDMLDEHDQNGKPLLPPKLEEGGLRSPPDQDKRGGKKHHRSGGKHHDDYWMDYWYYFWPEHDDDRDWPFDKEPADNEGRDHLEDDREWNKGMEWPFKPDEDFYDEYYEEYHDKDDYDSSEYDYDDEYDNDDEYDYQDDMKRRRRNADTRRRRPMPMETSNNGHEEPLREPDMNEDTEMPEPRPEHGPDSDLMDRDSEPLKEPHVPNPLTFNCVQLKVEYVNEDGHKKEGNLYRNWKYGQMYPNCSYSACHYKLREDKRDIKKFMDIWKSKEYSKDSHDDLATCYYHSDKSHHVIAQIRGHLGLAIFTVLAPLLFTITCAAILICRCCCCSSDRAIHQVKPQVQSGNLYKMDGPEKIAPIEWPVVNTQSVDLPEKKEGYCEDMEKGKEADNVEVFVVKTNTSPPPNYDEVTGKEESNKWQVFLFPPTYDDVVKVPEKIMPPVSSDA